MVTIKARACPVFQYNHESISPNENVYDFHVSQSRRKTISTVIARRVVFALVLSNFLIHLSSPCLRSYCIFNGLYVKTVPNFQLDARPPISGKYQRRLPPENELTANTQRFRMKFSIVLDGPKGKKIGFFQSVRWTERI